MNVEIGVRLPPDLVDRLDARAAELGISRSGLIVEAVTAALVPDGEWFQDFLSMLDPSSSPEYRLEPPEPSFHPRRRNGKGFLDLW